MRRTCAKAHGSHSKSRTKVLGYGNLYGSLSLYQLSHKRMAHYEMDFQKIPVL